MSRPKAAPATWPYDHRTIEEVDRQARLRASAINDIEAEPFEYRTHHHRMRMGSLRLREAIGRART